MPKNKGFCAKPKISGFTLIELMIVIAIIAILAGIGISSFRNASKNARIARRIQDLKAFKNALTIYKTNTGNYPIAQNGGGKAETVLASALVSYFSGGAIPKDPDGSHSYYYDSDATGANFKLTTDPGLTEMSSSDLSSQPGFTDPASQSNWAIYSPNVANVALVQGAQMVATTPTSGSSGGAYSGGIYTNGGGGASGGVVGSSYSNTILGDSPVSYWRLGESGYAADAAGNNSGTFVGSVTTGQPGALPFDPNTAITLGGSGYIQVANNANLNITNSITLEAWVNPVNLTNNWAAIIGKTTSGNWNDGYGLSHYTGTNDINFWVNSYSTAKASGTLTPGQWSYVVGTYDGSNIKLYINGSLVATTPYTGAILTTTAPLYIGALSGATSNAWNGSIDEVAIYNKALTLSQIQAHFNATNPYKPGLVAYYKMDEASWNGTAGEVKDSSVNQLNATAGCVGTGCAIPTTTTPAELNRAGNFSSGYVNLPNNSGSFNLSSLTVSAWINPSANCSSANVTCSIFSSVGSAWTGLGFWLNGGKLTVRDQDDHEIVTDTQSLSTGTWSMVTLTLDGCTGSSCFVKLYVNGSLRTVNVGGSGSPAGSSFTNGAPEYFVPNNVGTGPVHIGTDPNWGSPAGSANPFQGQIDEIGIWNRVLSASDIQNIYNTQSGGKNILGVSIHQSSLQPAASFLHRILPFLP